MHGGIKARGDLVSQGIGGAMVFFANPFCEVSQEGSAMNKFAFFLRSVVVGCVIVLAAASAADAAPKKNFKVAWSIYVGWMPWGYAADTGIVKKWADKYGITIEVKQFNDYVEIDQPVHRRRLRCRDHHQHGRAVDSRRRRRRHHARS